jgi:hypothetical protein
MIFFIFKINFETDVSRNEKGVATIEAAVVSMFFLPLIFMSIYLNLLSFRMNTAHYLIQNSLRAASTGPQGDVTPTTKKQHSSRFMVKLRDDLKSFAGINFTTSKLIFRNSFGCFNISGSQPIRLTNPAINCPAALNETDNNGLLIPNDFVSVELEVKILNGEVFGINFPKTTVTSGMQMGAF